jgi:hypothetical protein
MLPAVGGAEYRPPIRLRHVRAFLVRHLTLPREAGGGGALERECFLTLHCVTPAASASASASAPPPPPAVLPEAGDAEGVARAAHVTPVSIGTAFPEWPAPPAGALAPPGAPPDARRLVLTLRCRPAASAAPPAEAATPSPAEEAAADGGAVPGSGCKRGARGTSVVLSRVDVDLAALRALGDTVPNNLPPNTLLLRLEDGLLYAPAEALLGLEHSGADGSGGTTGVNVARAGLNGVAFARMPTGAPRRVPWGDARWDYQRLTGCRAGAARAVAARAAAAAAAGEALVAAAAHSGVQASARAVAEGRLHTARVRSTPRREHCAAHACVAACVF